MKGLGVKRETGYGVYLKVKQTYIHDLHKKFSTKNLGKTFFCVTLYFVRRFIYVIFYEHSVSILLFLIKHTRPRYFLSTFPVRTDSRKTYNIPFWILHTRPLKWYDHYASVPHFYFEKTSGTVLSLLLWTIHSSKSSMTQNKFPWKRIWLLIEKVRSWKSITNTGCIQYCV